MCLVVIAIEVGEKAVRRRLESGEGGEMGVVQNPPILGYKGAREPPAREGRISVRWLSDAGGGQPPRVMLVGAEVGRGRAASANADGLGRSSVAAGFCRCARHGGCA